MNLISYDKTTGQVQISLPDKAIHLANLLRDDLEAEFAFEPMVDKVVAAMNNFAAQWLNDRGIEVGENK